MTKTSFSVPLLVGDLLRPSTRDCVDSWLTGNPRSYHGETYLGIRQVFAIEPVPEALKKEPEKPGIARARAGQDLAYTPRSVEPFSEGEKGQVRLAWPGDLTLDHMRGYRDPHFMLCHDDTALRLINSRLSILCPPEGGSLSLYHLPGYTLVVSGADVHSLRGPDSEAPPEGLMTGIQAQEGSSQHERLKIAGRHDLAARLAYGCFHNGNAIGLPRHLDPVIGQAAEKTFA